MLVIDRCAVEAARVDDEIRGVTSRQDCVFDRIEANPTETLARAAIKSATQAGADGLVAIGGGSCIDLAKAVAAGVDPRNNLAGIMSGRSVIQGAIPLIAVPTTAGSGSQATSFGVLYVEGRKRSLDHPSLRPAASVLDHRFVEALPSKTSAVSGLDALCQCVESIWACRANETSRAFAAHGGKLIFENLVAAATNHDPVACRYIMVGSHLSGCAINISRTTAAHAYSYALTLRHGIPHGLAVTFALGWVARWNAGVEEVTCTHPDGPAAARRFVEQAASVLECSPLAMETTLRRLCSELELPPSMIDVGVRRNELQELSQAINLQRLSNNPRRLSHADILKCTEGLYEDLENCKLG